MRNKTFGHIVYMLLAVFIASNFTGCVFGPKDEIVELPNGYQLRKKPENEHFAVYTTWQVGADSYQKAVSEAIFDATFEPLNIAEVKGSDKMLILTAAGKKYLMDVLHGTLMLDGKPFIRYVKDNADGVCFETEEGKYFLAEVKGLPSIVDDYFRTGGDFDTFIYRLNGKWGVYKRFVKSGTNVFRDPVIEYYEVIPAKCDKIRYVRGAGAGHFVVQTGGRWKIVDYYGRDRLMVNGSFGHKLNIYSQNGSSEGSITPQYIQQIRVIPVGCKDRYVPYLQTKCSYEGNEEAGIITLEPRADRYQGFFEPNGDYSTFGLPWDEYDYHDLYHL